MDLLYNPDANYSNSIPTTSSRSWKRFLTKCCPLPQRYLLTLMGFLGLVMAYSMRLSLSVAITQMVAPPISNLSTIASIYSDPVIICPFEDENYINEHYDYEAIFDSLYNSNNEVFDWSQEQQGIILSSFFWGYLITQIPGGILSQRYGGKYVFMLGILFSAVCTILTPNVIQLAEANGLIVVRIFSGLGEGTMYAGLTELLAAWVPLKERTTLGSLAYGGSTVGTIGGTYLAALIIHEYKNWHQVFYFFGALTIGWCFLFLLLCYDGPEHHPFITDDEKKYLLDELGQQQPQQHHQPHDTTNGNKKKLPKPTPWRQILTNVPFIALILCQVCHEWAFCVVVLDLPKYMNDVLHFSIQDNGIYSSIPQVIKLVMALVTGVLSDYLISNEYLSITNGRKIFLAIASIFSGIFIVIASYAECDKIYVVAYFTISIAFQGVPGVAINILDLSPNYAAVLMGIGGAVTSITGILVPYLVGIVTPNSLLIEWRFVFWITFGLQVLKLVVFSIFGSGEKQSWDSYATKHRVYFNRNKSDFSFMSDVQTGSGYEDDDEDDDDDDDDIDESDSERLI